MQTKAMKVDQLQLRIGWTILKGAGRVLVARDGWE